MNKSDWDAIDKELSGYFGHVTLHVDGRKIDFYRRQVSKNRLGIATYVDGELRVVWLMASENCPESRYMRPMSRFVYSSQKRVKLKKWKKFELKALGIDPDKKILFFSFYWTSVAQIRRHYEKTFKSIELIEADK